MVSTGDLSICTYNVRGLNNDIKRNSVFKWARRKQFDILMLQETYSSREIENKWSNEWGGNIVFAHGSKHSKGTMIMFKPKLDMQIKAEKIDQDGRYIILELGYQSEIFTLANIYAPNKTAEKKAFFTNLNAMFDTMNIQPHTRLLCGGDWNSVLDKSLDKSGGKYEHENIVTEMKSLMDTYDLIDIWRVRNSREKRYTFRQKTPLVQTRLDYFLITDTIQDVIKGVEILPSVCSDHSSVVMYVSFLPDEVKGKGFWKFNCNHLKDIEFTDGMLELINNSLGKYADIEDKRVTWELLKFEVRQYCIRYGAKKSRETNINTGNLLQQLHVVEILNPYVLVYVRWNVYMRSIT